MYVLTQFKKDYLKYFAEHKIDGTVLRSLTMDMLKEDLGIQ